MGEVEDDEEKEAEKRILECSRARRRDSGVAQMGRRGSRKWRLLQGRVLRARPSGPRIGPFPFEETVNIGAFN